MTAIKSIETAFSLIKTDKSRILGLTFGATKVTPSQEIRKADVQSPPTLSLPSKIVSSTSTYVVIALDLDAPFPSFAVLGPVLHWIQPDLKLVPSSPKLALSSSAPFVADYSGPAPPPGTASHRYIFLLYGQPQGFDDKKYAPPYGKNMSTWNRLRYDLEAFEKEAGLGFVAANYFCTKCYNTSAAVANVQQKDNA